MVFLFPSLLGILLVFASQVAAVCENNQCASQIDPSKCVDLLATEELDCVTYTCKSDGGRLVLVKDETQVKRCSINGHCYEAGDGPNKCTFCQVVDGSTSIMAGCRKPDNDCAAPGAQFVDGCNLMQCTVQNHAASIITVGTIGCVLEGKCYGVGQETYRFTCNECALKENKYEWYRECRDPRNNQCFTKGTLWSYKCNTFICSNRRGVGWHIYSASHCVVSENDCIPVNSTSLRDGYCYYCDNADQPVARVGCRACDRCLKPGDTAECDGETVSCDNVEDPPEEVDITCRIGEEDVKVNGTVKYQCNNYLCTKFGVRQLTSNCSYEGECYRAGQTMNEALCLRCVSDGASTTSEQGCKRNGQCIAKDEIVRVNCVTKQCSLYGNMMEFRPTDYQPTPCVYANECYGVGFFHYGHDRTCAECKQNGTVILGCKLFNGQCLADGEAEAVPSKGCYKMQCTNLLLEKVPDQPLRCEVPGGRCLQENEIAQIGGVKHFCVAEDKCIFNNEEIVSIGEKRDYNCHRLVCQEVEIEGVKERKMVITDYGCPYVSGACKQLGDEYIMDCDTYRCVVPDGEIYASNELIINRCPCSTHCLEINSYLWTSDCAMMTCQESGEAVRTAVGCKSQLTSTCLTDGLSITLNGVTEVCEIGEDQALNNSLIATVTHCTFDGTMETVPYNTQIERSCNTWSCEERYGVISLYIVGQPRCKSGSGEDAVCVAAGDTYNCGICEYNMDSPTSHRVTYKQTQCHGHDGGSCVPPGETTKVSACKNAVCDANTLQLNVDSICEAQGVCFEPGVYKSFDYNGITFTCTCQDPESNQINCK